jgi:hypothetical protein
VADIVRVSYDDQWTYVVSGSEAHDHVCRFASQGLGEPGPAEVRLKSEAGPLLWELIGSHSRKREMPRTALDSMADGRILLRNSESLHLGKKSQHYNEFADISWDKTGDDRKGLGISDLPMQEGEIVLTAWPMAKRILPAHVIPVKNRFGLELVEAMPAGQRCFVINEKGTDLMTVGMPSVGTEFIGMVPTVAFGSWLFSVGSKSVRDSKFKVADRGEMFLIEDMEAGSSYLGKYAGKDKQVEIENIRCMLNCEGLGAILPQYRLENA